jgi:hypothetical protein
LTIPLAQELRPNAVGQHPILRGDSLGSTVVSVSRNNLQNVSIAARLFGI